MGRGAVTTTALADAAVTGAKMGRGAVTTTVLADAAVTGAKISPGAITAAHLAPGAMPAPPPAQAQAPAPAPGREEVQIRQLQFPEPTKGGGGVHLVGGDARQATTFTLGPSFVVDAARTIHVRPHTRKPRHVAYAFGILCSCLVSGMLLVGIRHLERRVQVLEQLRATHADQLARLEALGREAVSSDVDDGAGTAAAVVDSHGTRGAGGGSCGTAYGGGAQVAVGTILSTLMAIAGVIMSNRTDVALPDMLRSGTGTATA